MVFVSYSVHNENENDKENWMLWAVEARDCEIRWGWDNKSEYSIETCRREPKGPVREKPPKILRRDFFVFSYSY